jgi:predicted aspartyl protease
MSRRWLRFNKHSLPVVQVHIEGERYTALIDTGAGISFIEPQLALEFGLPKVGEYLIRTLGGRQSFCRTVELPPVGFAGLELTPCLAAVDSLSSLRLNINFILGVNAFTNRRLHIDFKEGRVYIFPER